MRLSRKHNRDSLPFLFLGVISPDDNQGADDSEIRRKPQSPTLRQSRFGDRLSFIGFPWISFIFRKAANSTHPPSWVELANPIPRHMSEKHYAGKFTSKRDRPQ